MKCKICEKEFKTKKGLSGHIVQYHKISKKDYLILYDENYPLCPVCNKPVNYTSKKGYHKTCGDKTCIKKHRYNKIKQTNLKKYGVENPFQSEKIKDKIKQTNIEKYGVDNPAKSEKIKEKISKNIKKSYTEEIKEKIKQTNIEKYGVDNPAKSEKIKEKIKQNYLEKYGVINNSQTDEYKKQVKKTCLEKYGVEYYSQTDEYKKQVKKTNLEKYKTKYYSQTNEYKKQVKKTCLEKYGVESYSQTDEYRKQVKQTCLEKYGVENYSQTDEYKKKSHETKKKNKSYGKSKTEDNVYTYIKENIDENVKRQVFVSKWNIDFYLPKYDLYVQFDGDYWHGYLNTKEELSQTQQGRHIIKMMEHDKEQNKTIPNLIRIRESEWKKNKNIINEKIIKYNV